MKQDLMKVDDMSKDELIQELIENQIIPNDQVDLFKKSNKDTLEHLVTCARAKWEDKPEGEDSEELIAFRKENEELKSQNAILQSEKEEAESELEKIKENGSGDVVPKSDFEELSEKYKQKDLELQSCLMTLDNIKMNESELDEAVVRRRENQSKIEFRKYLNNLSDSIKNKANSI